MRDIFNSDRFINHRRRAAHGLGRMHDLINYFGAELIDRVKDIDRDFEQVVQYGAWKGQFADRLIATNKISQLYVTDPVDEMLAGDSHFHGICHPMELSPIGEKQADMIISPVVMHLVSDLPGLLAQINWALRPDGVFIGMMVGGQSLVELSTSLMAAEEEIAGGVAQRIHPRISLSDLSALLQRAKFALPVADHEQITLRYRDLNGLINDLRAVGMTNCLTNIHPLARSVWKRTERIYKDKFSDEDGYLTATIDVLCAIGWRPDKSQPQPLKPGSADHRLADALQTDEKPAGDTTGEIV